MISEIKERCKKANAIILAHYYQAPEIQEIADFIGDSLDLSRKAANNDADIIIFCGVHFMAETAKILSPNKTVLLPDIDAGCSLADDCPSDKFQKFREENPDHYVVSYINCTAEVKAQSDLICTSSNAVSLIKKIPQDKKIIFAPDQNLGRWVQKNSGRDLKLWPGSCIVHESFSEEALLKLKYQNPGSKVIAHPECSQNLLILSDFIGSTSKLLDFVSKDPSKTYMVLTEPGIVILKKRIILISIKKASRTSTRNTAIVAPKIVSNAVIMLLAPSLANSFKLCISDVILATNTPVLFFSK